MSGPVPPPPAHAPEAYHLAIEATLRDTDGLGVVNNAVYMTWVETVRTRYAYERRGMTQVGDFDFILASTTLEFRSPTRMLETVDLWCWPARVGHKSCVLRTEARARTDGRLVLEARATLVQYDFAARRTVPLDPGWRAILEQELVPDPD